MESYFDKQAKCLYNKAEEIINTYAMLKANKKGENFDIDISQDFKDDFFKLVDKVNLSLMEDKDNFYGYFLFQTLRDIRFDISSPTAVNFKGAKYVIYFNPIIFLSLDMKQMESTIKHEILHILSLHLLRGKELKNLTAQVNHRILSIANAKLSNAKILSNGYLLRITDSEIKNSQLITTGIVNVFETSLTDSRIQADHEHIKADDIQVHGRVEFEARKDISLELSQKELDRINVEFSAEHGDIYRWHRDRRDIPTGGSKGEALANPYKTEKKDTQDLLVAKSNQSIYFP